MSRKPEPLNVESLHHIELLSKLLKLQVDVPPRAIGAVNIVVRNQTGIDLLASLLTYCHFQPLVKGS